MLTLEQTKKYWSDELLRVQALNFHHMIEDIFQNQLKHEFSKNTFTIVSRARRYILTCNYCRLAERPSDVIVWTTNKQKIELSESENIHLYFALRLFIKKQKN